MPTIELKSKEPTRKRRHSAPDVVYEGTNAAVASGNGAKDATMDTANDNNGTTTISNSDDNNNNTSTSLSKQRESPLHKHFKSDTSANNNICNNHSLPTVGHSG